MRFFQLSNLMKPDMSFLLFWGASASKFVKNDPERLKWRAVLYFSQLNYSWLFLAREQICYQAVFMSIFLIAAAAGLDRCCFFWAFSSKKAQSDFRRKQPQKSFYSRPRMVMKNLHFYECIMINLCIFDSTSFYFGKKQIRIRGHFPIYHYIFQKRAKFKVTMSKKTTTAEGF